jgi:hypothetical protein
MGERSILPAWSFLVNSTSWLKMTLHPLKKLAVKKELLRLINSVKDISDIDRELLKFRWTKDRCIDWKPWISVFLYRDKRDDCDGAAAYTKFLCDLAKVEAEVIVLIGIGWKTENHAVCLVGLRGVARLYSNGVSVTIAKTKEEALKLYIDGCNEWNQKFYHKTV